MSDELVFDVAARDVKPIPVRLRNPDGTEDVYTFTPPKDTRGMLSVIDPAKYGDRTPVEENLQWIYEGLPAEQVARLKGRLEDPADPLGMATMDQVLSGLLQAASGRPTTPPSGSSPASPPSGNSSTGT